MDAKYREVHRAEINRRLHSYYQRHARGVYTAAILAGFFGGFLYLWPVALAVYLLFVAIAIKGSVEREGNGVWDQVVVGWIQYSYLFVVGFLSSLSVTKGWGVLVAFMALMLLPAPLFYYNKKKHFKAYFYNVARDYLREIGDLRKLQ